MSSYSWFSVLIVTVLVCLQCLFGQQNLTDDKVFQKNGKEILCKILIINRTMVKIDPKGPISLKIIPGDEIESISFANGEVLGFPLPTDYEFAAETIDYDNPFVVNRKRGQFSNVSIFYGPNRGADTDPIMGIPIRFDDSCILGMRVSLYYPELAFGTLGYNVIFSGTKYSISSLFNNAYEEIMDGTVLNLDMSGEFLLFDVTKLFIPNPYIMVGFGVSRFLGEDVSELDFSINYGAGIRLLFAENIGLGFTIKRRPVWIKDMGSPNFVEMSGELFFQTVIRK